VLQKYFCLRSKAIILAIFGFALLVGTGIVAMQWLRSKVDNYIIDIEPTLSSQFGQIITISKTHVDWHWLELTVEMDDFLLQDRATTIPLFKAAKVMATVNLWRTALNKALKLSYLDFIDPQMVVQQDENNEYNVIGLSGEFVPGKIPIDLVLNMLSSNLELGIINGRFTLQVEPNIHLPTLNVSLIAKFSGDSSQWKIAANKVTVSMPDALLNMDIKAHYEPKALHKLALQAKLHTTPVATLYAYLPLLYSLPPELESWFSMAFANNGGTIEHANLTFKDDKVAAEITCTDVDLQYAKNWPGLANLTGTVTVADNVVSITTTGGSISGAEIDTATATITDIQGDNGTPLLTVNAKIATSLTRGLDFLLHSPLRDIGGSIQQLQPKGGMQLALGLDIPLDGKLETKVLGDLLVEHTTLNSDLDASEQINNFSGKFKFTETDFQAQDLKFMFQGNPGQGSGVLAQGGRAVNLDLDVVLASKYLANSWPLLKDFNLKGDTPAKITVIIPNRAAVAKEITIKTDLVGMEIDLPQPFFKPKMDKRPTTIISNDQGMVKNKTLLVDIAGLLQAKLLLKQNKISSGRVVLGKKSATEIPGQDAIYIQGNLPQLNLNAWHGFLDNHVPALSKQDLTVELLVDELELFGSKFLNTWLTFNSKRQAITLAGDDINGDIMLASNHLPIDIKLHKLYLHPKASSTGVKSTTQLPMVTFSCNDVVYNDNNIGHVSFNLLPQEYGYDINNLAVENRNFKFHGNGSTHTLVNSHSHLSGNISSKNIGKLFQDWKLGDSISNGSGSIDFLLAWEDKLENFSLDKSSGNVQVNIKNGQLLGINPGLGRIVGLLSFESIQRRMQLNFSDVLKKGFAFDTLVTTLKLNHGVLNTVDELIIEGPSARISLAGQAWIATKAVDLHMNVMSKASATLPLAAAIAVGNPAVGVAVWFVEHVSGKSNSKNTEHISYKYKVTGTWDQPKIDEERSSRSR